MVCVIFQPISQCNLIFDAPSDALWFICVCRALKTIREGYSLLALLPSQTRMPNFVKFWQMSDKYQINIWDGNCCERFENDCSKGFLFLTHSKRYYFQNQLTCNFSKYISFYTSLYNKCKCIHKCKYGLYFINVDRDFFLFILLHLSNMKIYAYECTLQYTSVIHVSFNKRTLKVPQPLSQFCVSSSSDFGRGFQKNFQKSRRKECGVKSAGLWSPVRAKLFDWLRAVGAILPRWQASGSSSLVAEWCWRGRDLAEAKGKKHVGVRVFVSGSREVETGTALCALLVCSRAYVTGHRANQSTQLS